MNHQNIFDLEISGPVICISCSDDGNKIAVGDRNGNLTLVNRNGEQIWGKKIDEGIHGISILKNGGNVICGGKDCKLKMLNSLGNVEWEQTIGKSIWSLYADTEGQFIIVGTGDSIAMFTEKGLQLWEYTTNRAMVGVGASQHGNLIMGCGDEYLYCLDNEGNLIWEKQHSDSLWDVSTGQDGETIFIGGWDCKVQALNKEGENSWDFMTEGYVRAVVPLPDGGVLAGSHDNKIYHLSNNGDLLEKFETNGEITCISTSQQMDFAVAGSGNRILAFNMDTNAKPIPIEENIPEPLIEENTTTEINNTVQEETEPMFGFGMFDEPMPDTSGILSESEENKNEYSKNTISESGISNTNSPYTNYYAEKPELSEGGEFKEFASEMVKGDVKNYLRLGNAAWYEKRLERAAEHYKRATEIDSKEPRAWLNLAICNYHVALKRNPEDIEGAVQCAMGPLEMAKEKGGEGYITANKTLAYFASQLGIIEEKS